MGVWNAIAVLNTLDNLQNGLGDWIANGTPENIWAQAVQRRYRDQCDSYSNGPAWVSVLIDSSPVTGPAMGAVCDPWLESQGSGSPVAVPGSVADQFDGEDLSKYGGARILIRRNESIGGDLTENVIRWEVTFNEFTQSERLERWDCNDSRIGSTPFESIEILEWGVCGGATEPPPGPPPPSIDPHPNPRPDPGLDPTEEPQPGPTGEPVFPMPDLPNPFGDPIPVPDFGLPFPFGGAPEGGGQPYAPPPPEPSPDGPIDGDNKDENGDNDFGDPPEGERWVGCAVDMTSEPIGVGSFPAAEPDRIYPSVAGNARLVFGNGDRQLDTPIQIRSRRVFLWEGVEGCSPTGCRVNVAPGFSYEVTPFSVPIEPEEPPAIV